MTPAKEKEDRPGQALFFVAAAAALGQALAISNGHQNPSAMWLVTITLALLVTGIMWPRLPSLIRWQESATLVLLGLALTWQFANLLHNAPGIYLEPRSAWQHLWFVLGVTTAAVLTGGGLVEKPPLGRWRMPLLLVVHFLLGCWLIAASPHPIIDVDLVQRDSLNAMLHGKSPYGLTFQNIYGSTAFFGTALADNQRINIGFPYLPASLLFALPGHLFGDYRYSQLASMVLAGALMAYSRPGRLAPSIATLFLFTPRVLFVLEQGWTDPYLVLMVAAIVFAALRRPKLVPWLFGVFLALKQYAVLAVAFSWLLVRPFTWREFGLHALKAGAVMSLLIVPFLLWDPGAFLFSAVTSQGGLPFRPDALSFPAWLGGAHDQRWSSLSAGALVSALAIAGWRTSRTPAGFAAAVALLTFAFFAFGGHAFCNHYYFVLGLICIAAATSSPEDPSHGVGVPNA